MRWLPDGDQRVAQILSRHALNHPHGTGAEDTERESTLYMNNRDEPDQNLTNVNRHLQIY